MEIKNTKDKELKFAAFSGTGKELTFEVNRFLEHHRNITIIDKFDGTNSVHLYYYEDERIL